MESRQQSPVTDLPPEITQPPAPVKPKKAFIIQVITGIVIGGLILGALYTAYIITGFAGIGEDCKERGRDAVSSIDSNLSRITIPGHTPSSVSTMTTGNCVDVAMNARGSVKFTGGSMTADQVTKYLEVSLKPKNNLAQTSSVDELRVPDPTQPRNRIIDKNNFNSISLNSLDEKSGNYLVTYKLGKTINCPAITSTICDKNNRTAITTYMISDEPVTSITISQSLDIR